MKIAIVGPGLIGRSIALAARRAQPDLEIVEVDRDEPLDAVSGSSIVVLATPVDVIRDTLRYFCEAFPEALVLDTGSTKRAIVAAARDARLTNFVASHPMAGAAAAGAANARVDLFDHATWFLVRGAADPTSVEAARRFVARLGATPMIFEDDGTEHDRMMAAVSHLPQLVASVLMAVAGDAAGESGLQWAGRGLRDTTRLAGSRASVWQSIFASNEAELRPLLRTMADALSRMADRLDDPQTVSRLFEVANRYRDQLR